jgi:HK97 family phage portal protein
VAWWRRKAVEPKAVTYSVSDPVLSQILGAGWPNDSGVEVSDRSALGISAFWRGVSLLSGVIGGLPMPTLMPQPGGLLTPVSSFLDTPAGPGPDRPTTFEFFQTVTLHLLLRGNAFLRHVYGGAGQMIALDPVWPGSVTVDEAAVNSRGEPITGKRLYTTTLLDGRRLELDATGMTHIPNLSLDGLRGLSIIDVARNSLGTAIAGNRSAARMFSRGALIGGIASAEEDVDPDEAKIIRRELDLKTAGWENAGSVPFINRKIKFNPWTMSAKDAQFLESRTFQVEEIARWLGVPPHLLMQTDKQTSWGTGVAEQNRGLARYSIAPWTTLIEQRLSRLVPGKLITRFDFSRLERPNPETEIPLIIQQIEARLLSVDEGRAMLGRAPLPGGTND